MFRKSIYVYLFISILERIDILTSPSRITRVKEVLYMPLKGEYDQLLTKYSITRLYRKLL